MIAFNFKALHYIDDEILMGGDKNGVVKNDGGNKKYVIYLSKQHHDFTHTIEDDSETLGKIYLIRRTRRVSYENHDLRDVVFEETQ